MLEDIREKQGVDFRVIALDMNAARRDKLLAMVHTIYDGQVPHNITVADIDVGKKIIGDWTGGLGCNAVLEVRYFTVSKGFRSKYSLQGCWQ